MQTNTNNQLVAQAARPLTFSGYMTGEGVKRRINEMLGSKRGERFIASVVSAVAVNANLKDCASDSILSAALLGESLNLAPSPQLGYYYIVPYAGRAQFQIGYKGLIQLAIRSGFYKKIHVIEIKEGEEIAVDLFNDDITCIRMMNDLAAREKAKTVGYYAMFETNNGFVKKMYMTFDQMMLYADTYSKAFSAKKYQDFIGGKVAEKDMSKFSSFWYKDFDGMAKKTMLRRLLSKWGLMSVELEKAFSNDEAVIDNNGNAVYADNMPNESTTADGILFGSDSSGAEATEND